VYDDTSSVTTNDSETIDIFDDSDFIRRFHHLKELPNFGGDQTKKLGKMAVFPEMFRKHNLQEG